MWRKLFARDWCICYYLMDVFSLFRVGISEIISMILVGCSIMSQLWNNCECTVHGHLRFLTQS